MERSGVKNSENIRRIATAFILWILHCVQNDGHIFQSQHL